ncbi:hypothetical protein [Streptomyces sp. NPDC001889]
MSGRADVQHTILAAHRTERDATATCTSPPGSWSAAEPCTGYGPAVERPRASRSWAVVLIDRTPAEGAPDARARAVLSLNPAA